MRTAWSRFDEPMNEQRAIVAVESLLRERVTERLESEVPLGAFLSGGIDSGLVVSYMAEATGQRVVTTTVGCARWSASTGAETHFPRDNDAHPDPKSGSKVVELLIDN